MFWCWKAEKNHMVFVKSMLNVFILSSQCDNRTMQIIHKSKPNSCSTFRFKHANCNAASALCRIFGHHLFVWATDVHVSINGFFFKSDDKINWHFPEFFAVWTILRKKNDDSLSKLKCSAIKISFRTIFPNKFLRK